jgi:N-acetylglucosamine-6-phosphate deacetylase
VRLAGRVVTPAGVVTGELVVEGGRVAAVERRPEAPSRWVAPGFIDLQINGAHGIDVTATPARIPELAQRLPEQGVTAFLPTVITCPDDVRQRALDAVAALAPGPGAVPLGLHLEGPMLSPVRRGAHPEADLALPSAALVEGWSRDTGVALATIAPELPGALDVIATLASRGVTVSLGHTDATATEFAAGRAAGARYVTHLFNAMRPFGHRDPGPIGAALADPDLVVGLICDGVHVDPVAVRMAWRALGPHRLNLVTDAVAALGNDSAAAIGSVGITVDATAVRTATGVLAGSLLRLDAALRNLVAFTGCAVPDAVATVTSTPAAVLGLSDRGRLERGARADVAVLDDDLRVVETIVGGEVAWRS